MRPQRSSRPWALAAVLCLLLCLPSASASLGDRLPEFQECLDVCNEVNCGPDPTSIPLHHRLLWWTCPSECDYHCQHIVTAAREERDPPDPDAVLQFHGKWPFWRFLGMQEPLSVLFSFLNYAAHSWGLYELNNQPATAVPSNYPMKKYYLGFGYCGLASWIFSMVFHTRDFRSTEKLDYFAAGLSVLYGLYYAPIRIFHLYRPDPPYPSVLRLWTLICAVCYISHISYLTFWRFDYGYNMTANVIVGIISNLLWSGFSIIRYRRLKRGWATWPGLIVAWVVMAMSFELLDFPPFGRMLDAHALWHLGTVIPTIWWYSFLIKDAKEQTQARRLKA